MENILLIAMPSDRFESSIEYALFEKDGSEYMSTIFSIFLLLIYPR